MNTHLQLLLKAVARSAERLQELANREAPDVCLELELNNLNRRLKQVAFLRNCGKLDKKAA